MVYVRWKVSYMYIHAIWFSVLKYANHAGVSLSLDLDAAHLCCLFTLSYTHKHYIEK